MPCKPVNTVVMLLKCFAVKESTAGQISAINARLACAAPRHSYLTPQTQLHAQHVMTLVLVALA